MLDPYAIAFKQTFGARAKFDMESEAFFLSPYAHDLRGRLYGFAKVKRLGLQGKLARFDFRDIEDIRQKKF